MVKEIYFYEEVKGEILTLEQLFSRKNNMDKKEFAKLKIQKVKKSNQPTSIEIDGFYWKII